MDIFSKLLDGVGLLNGIALVVAAVFSKTIVYGRLFGGKPQKITGFGRIFLFLAGSGCAYGFGHAFPKQLHVEVDTRWLNFQPLSEFVLSLLFLSFAIPFLIDSVRNLWLKRKTDTQIQRIILTCMALIFLYLIWETLPTVMMGVLTLFRRVPVSHLILLLD